ncbi:ATP-binding cassette domain-containing protein [Campylobacter fetus]|uniref:Peptide ABC transporter ATP-binding protein n=1 Tax=Campylobacter fetus subsp. testudinum TaxID=1507806 RepID=A0AAX0HAX2_CAMFE|nr:ATP-binding cassette domain-containing protein [Campylobacter fetus]AGZ82449.1 peptide ABC transporter, ATP-binding protein [Campylobacter fetus subsp. testudinum 03-427]AJB46170.1 peptide ABC transporter ATP-binding protein [Campylobacter fetus subsp. testudinum]ALV65617.1 peptide ABC transporter, ATP-binding protein [Campylobacter fetus subsp. testudinum Sp3]AVK81859.1 ABC transporter ATP-binding protein [Campylobacter fetus subsp. testudinum]EAI4322545.1 ABC transporter ATP-binding prote
MIEVLNLNIKAKNTQILHNISFISNSNLAILGSSGSGKSTLCKAICSILPDNLKASYTKLQTDQKPAYIFQDCISCFYPYLKIKDTFKMVLKESANSTHQIFDELHIPKKAWEMYPYELSRGIASRVQIALNLALDAKILLLDEVTSSLDETNTNSVIEILLRLNTQKVVITHDENLAFKLCDEVLVLENGYVTYFGDKIGYFS